MESMALMHLLRNRKVLVTGHTGFKGAWLTIWLEKLGAEVIGVSLDPLHEDGVYVRSGIGGRIRDHRLDIRDLDGLLELFRSEAPEMVFHLAAQALVLESYRTPVETFGVNTMGTAHVLEAIRRTPSVKAAVMVTTDKCYENTGTSEGYRETDAMGGHDPYSASKGAAELVIASYRRSYFSASGSPGVASVRAGNVIGGGDRSADRLVPDLIRAVERNEVLPIRHPDAVRPWQHVLEPLHGYMLLAERLLEDPVRYASAWNFGPRPEEAFTVRQLADGLVDRMGRGRWQHVPAPHQGHEAAMLLLNIDKAGKELDWQPRLHFTDTVRLVADWYNGSTTGGALALCHAQIDEYEGIGDRKG